MDLVIKIIHSNSGFVDSCLIKNYEKNREKYVEKGRGMAFKEAVKQMDEIIADPKVAFVFFFNVKNKQLIQILFTDIQKKEPDISTPLDSVKCSKVKMIKNERATPKINNSLRQQTPQSSWLNEKQALAKRMVALKAENNKHLLDLKEIESENAKLLSQNDDFNSKLISVKKQLSEARESNERISVALRLEQTKSQQFILAHQSQVIDLESKLAATTNEITNATTANDKIKAEFAREKKMLLERIKQLESNQSQFANQITKMNMRLKRYSMINTPKTGESI